MIKKEWLDSLFAINPWYYELEKEVRKRMAINYKEEWEKLEKEHGSDAILPATGYGTALGNIMVAQIRRTINKREHLMKEYVKENITTDIVDGDKDFHYITIINTRTKGQKSPIGTMYINKVDFATWCKKKERR